MNEDTNTIEPPPAGRRQEPIVMQPDERVQLWLAMNSDLFDPMEVIAKGTETDDMLGNLVRAKRVMIKRLCLAFSDGLQIGGGT